MDPQPNSLARELGVRPLPRPGCAFRYRGRYLYFATEMQTVVEIDEASYLAITALLVGRSLAQAWQLTQRRGVRITPDEIRKRLIGFREAGLFASPPEERLRMDIDQTVDVLMKNQPMKMMLFMAESCNLRCTYCYGIEGNYEDKGEKMTPELASTAIDYLFARSPARPHYYIYFFGGEPLINLPTIEHTVLYGKERAKAAGKTIEFGLTTNGTLLNDRALDVLIEHDFQVCVSLDGTPEKHDHNRPTKGGGGSFERALAGYRRLMARSTRSNQVKVRATMSHQNHDPLEIADYFESIGIKKYGIGTAFERSGNGTGPGLPTDPDQNCGNSTGAGQPNDPDQNCGNSTGAGQPNDPDQNCGNATAGGSTDQDQNCGNAAPGGGFDQDQNCGNPTAGAGFDQDENCGMQVSGPQVDADQNCGRPIGGGLVDKDNSCGTMTQSGFDIEDSSCGQMVGPPPGTPDPDGP